MFKHHEPLLSAMVAYYQPLFTSVGVNWRLGHRLVAQAMATTDPPAYW